MSEAKFYPIDPLDAYPEPVGTDDKLEHVDGAVFVHLNGRRAKLAGVQSLAFLIEQLQTIRANVFGAAPVAQAVDEEAERAEFERVVYGDRLKGHAILKWDANRGEYACQTPRVEFSVWLKRAAIAAPVQPACKTPSGSDCPGDGVGPCKLCPEAAPVQSEHEPVARVNVERSGNIEWLVNPAPADATELYAAPVRAVRMPEQLGDRCDSSEAEAYQNGWNACLDAVAQLNAQPAGPES